MKPIYFKQATIELKKPASMTDEECNSLWVCRTEKGECISLWTASFWERLKFLFHGKLWLRVLSGNTQPPVLVDMTKTVFIEQDENSVTLHNCYKTGDPCSYNCDGQCKDAC